MECRGELQIDPGTLEADGSLGELELVVPYTEWSVTEAVMKRAAVMTAGLNARLTLVAVHTVPYPATFSCPISVHAHLVEQLIDLASRSSLPVDPQVVLARSREEGFQHILKPASTVLIGTRRHFWRTAEEKLARRLVRDGHKVALLHLS
jgi:metal-dependent amidase/aminoacylase/carboxypeptidase family protein